MFGDHTLVSSCTSGSSIDAAIHFDYNTNTSAS